MMATSLKTMMKRLPAERRKKVKARAAALIAEEMTLRDLRKARARTQVDMAQKLKVGQDSISRLEKRQDMYLSTIRDYVEALGGTLELVVKFPDRPDVVVTGFEEAGADYEPASRPPRRRT
jgi:transcriptional regulator with XRE-family HTH domain